MNSRKFAHISKNTQRVEKFFTNDKECKRSSLSVTPPSTLRIGRKKLNIKGKIYKKREREREKET